MKKLFTTILSFFLCIIFTSCADDDNTKTQNIETILTITDYEDNESSTFVQGEDIKFIIQMRNLTNSTQTLRFSSGKHYDIEIYDSDDYLIWNWANGVTFITSETELVFNANEIKSYEVIWDQISNDGNPSSLETYNGYFIGEGSLGSAGPYSFEIM